LLSISPPTAVSATLLRVEAAAGEEEEEEEEEDEAEEDEEPALEEKAEFAEVAGVGEVLNVRGRKRKVRSS
jgi:hypothetical protein